VGKHTLIIVEYCSLAVVPVQSVLPQTCCTRGSPPAVFPRVAMPVVSATESHWWVLLTPLWKTYNAYIYKQHQVTAYPTMPRFTLPQHANKVQSVVGVIVNGTGDCLRHHIPQCPASHYPNMLTKCGV